jgi:hypothetical protein
LKRKALMPIIPKENSKIKMRSQLMILFSKFPLFVALTGSSLDLDLPSENAANILKEVLDVDEELYQHVIKRELSVSGKKFSL